MLASPLGLLLALLPDTVYSFYEARPTVWGLSHILDQEIAGTTMAAEQAIVFFAAFVFYFARFLQRGGGRVPAALEQRAHALDARAPDLEHLVVRPRVATAERAVARDAPRGGRLERQRQRDAAPSAPREARRPRAASTGSSPTTRRATRPGRTSRPPRATSGELHQSCQIASASACAPFHSTTRERAGVLPP